LERISTFKLKDEWNQVFPNLKKLTTTILNTPRSFEIRKGRERPRIEGFQHLHNKWYSHWTPLFGITVPFIVFPFCSSSDLHSFVGDNIVILHEPIIREMGCKTDHFSGLVFD